jgi:hypothetical protein
MPVGNIIPPISFHPAYTADRSKFGRGDGRLRHSGRGSHSASGEGSHTGRGSHSASGDARKHRKPSARNLIVKRVMMERGCSLPEASAIVKREGLY